MAICGSDPPLLAGESLKDDLPAYMPFIPGHEGAGVVEAAGSGVTDFKPGDMVAAEAPSWVRTLRQLQDGGV